MLTALGLDPLSEAVYRLFLYEPAWSAERVGDRLGLAPTEVDHALDKLTRARLLTGPREASGDFRATDPSIGLPRLLADREAELERQRQEVHAARDAVSTLAGLGGAAAGYEVLERLPDQDAVARRVAELASGARLCFETLVPHEHQECLSPERMRPLDEALIARGVCVRRVQQNSARSDPAARRHLAWLTATGGRARTVPSLPIVLILVDGQTALVPTDPSDPGSGGVQLRCPGVVSALQLLFDAYWKDGTDWGGPPPHRRDQLTPVEQELLRLLAVGWTDAQISRRLGVSLRTVRRVYAGIGERYAVRSRFEAGVVAAQRGWV